MNSLLKLNELGQSVWQDNLTREMLNDGELERRIKDDGITGITSNPKTFADSLQGSDLYAQDIQRMQKEGATVPDIYEQLMVDDVQRACDLLRPVYDKTEGLDGFVSIEVDPRLARKTDETLQVARKLHKLVDRPNCMVKIPGTQEGLPAIESALSDGIPINITLLFSHGRYRQVLACYLRAMERRVERGEMPQVPSVASFFLSRIDSLVDELLDHRCSPKGGEQLAQKMKGKMALAEARLAYKAFQESMQGDIWKKLDGLGAQPQRVLWASTSTKNPDYPATMYVDNLIAPHTVNTMPEKTLQAFQEDGKATANSIENIEGDPQAILQSVRSLDVDLDYVGQRLEDEGIQKFIEPFLSGVKATEETAKG